MRFHDSPPVIKSKKLSTKLFGLCSDESIISHWMILNRYLLFCVYDLKAVGQRIKAAREAKNLTQEELAALVSLSPTHVSVIERGLKVTKLDTFIAIANALDVSADTLLIDVVTHSVTGVTNELSEMIEKLPKEKQQRIINAVRALVE